jgi:hypothetical protein
MSKRGSPVSWRRWIRRRLANAPRAFQARPPPTLPVSAYDQGFVQPSRGSLGRYRGLPRPLVSRHPPRASPPRRPARRPRPSGPCEQARARYRDGLTKPNRRTLASRRSGLSLRSRSPSHPAGPPLKLPDSRPHGKIISSANRIPRPVDIAWEPVDIAPRSPNQYYLRMGLLVQRN